MQTGGTPEPSGVGLDQRALELLSSVALRAEVARRMLGGGTEAVLRSVVDATVALFQAEAASIALYDPEAGRLVFRVAAGEQGAGVVGLSVGTGEGLVGYVFSTGQSIAQSDVERDARFGREVAEKTRYTPRSLIAVPLVDEQGTIGVLEVLDKRDSPSFSLHDIELASIFAHQAAVAISASRVERDVAALLAASLRALAIQPAGGPPARPQGQTTREPGAEPHASAGESAEGDDDVVARIVAAATRGLDDEDSRVWELVEQIASVRDADPAQLELVIDLVAVLARHARRGREASHRLGRR